MNNQSITSNFAWKLAERLLARGIEFFVSIIIARILTPKDYGIVAIVLVFIVLADVFVTSGFSSALIQKKDANETDFSTVFYCSLIISLVIYLIIYCLAPLIAEYYKIEELTLVTRIFALKIPLSVYNSVQHAYVSRHMLFRRFFLSTLVGTLLSGVVGMYLAYNGMGVWALIAQYFVNTIANTIVLAITVSWKPKFVFDICSAKKMLDYGWKILVSNLMGEFFGQLRNLVVGKYFSASSLAIYNRGQQIPSLIYNNISSSITSVTFPAMSNYNDDISRIKQITSQTTSIMAFLLFPILILFVIIAKPFTIILLTEKWIECVPFLQIISIDYCVAICGISILPAIKAIGRSDVVLKLEFIKKPIFILLLIIGIKIGLLAVAITMVFYEIIGTVINLMTSGKYIGYSLLDAIKDIKQPLFFSILAGCVSYICSFFIFNYYILVGTEILIFVVVYLVSAMKCNNNEFRYIIKKLKIQKR